MSDDNTIVLARKFPGVFVYMPREVFWFTYSQLNSYKTKLNCS